MRKIYGLLVLLVAVNLSLAAKNTVVTTTAEFQNAWSALTLTPESNDTIIVAPGTYSLNSNCKFPSAGRVHVIGQVADWDSIPVLSMEMTADSIAEGSNVGLLFEWVNVQYKGGATASSGQVFYINKKFAAIDSMVFRHCEITNIPRTLYRSVPPQSDGVYRYGGDINYFEMSDCKVHYMCLNSGNCWPLIYFGQIPLELVVKNNLFYDMPFIKNIFTMNYITDPTGRNATITFENNTVAVASNHWQGLLNPGTFLGEEAVYNINNNIFVSPNFEDDLNVNDTVMPAILSAKYGYVHAFNNMIEGFGYWDKGNIKEDGVGTWFEADTTENYTMADLEFLWDDFAAPQNDNYSYLSTIKAATASTEEGPIGAPWLVVTYDNPTYLTTSSNVEQAVITPAKGVYEQGTEISVSASDVQGYKFASWQTVEGTVLSTENPYTFVINANTEVKAIYDALDSCKVTFSIAGSKSAEYSLTPVRSTYYIEDEITVSLKDHGLNEFLGWNDGNMEMVRTFAITADADYVASFKEEKYIAAWDLCQLTKNNVKVDSNLVANHFDSEFNKGYLNMTYYLDNAYRDTSKYETRNNKLGKDVINCFRRYSSKESFETHPDYLYAKFSTLTYTGISVKSFVGTDNKMHSKQLLQWSLDNVDENYKTFGSVVADSVGIWFALEGTLPEEADNKEMVYVRWIGDVTSERILGESSTDDREFAYTGGLKILYTTSTGIQSMASDVVRPRFMVEGNVVSVSNVAVSKAILYTLDGKKLMSKPVNGDFNIELPAHGFYLLQVGDTTAKILY